MVCAVVFAIEKIWLRNFGGSRKQPRNYFQFYLLSFNSQTVSYLRGKENQFGLCEYTELVFWQ